MYLFTRTGQLRPAKSRRGLTVALEMVDRVNRLTDLQLSCYAQVFSPQAGTVTWGAFVPDLLALEAANDKLVVDPEFMEASERAAELLMGPVDDQVRQVVHGTPDPDRPAEYVVAVRAVCANGRIADGMAVGVRIAQEAERITGGPTMFLAESTGTYGGVGWLTPYADLPSLERAEQALLAEPSWLQLIDGEAGAAYQADPLVTTQRIFRRMA